MKRDADPIRYPQMAGTWYPGDASELAALVDRFLAEAAPQVPHVSVDTRLAGLVAPHAGYVYSGRCAGFAYAALGDWRPARVIVVAPSHRESFPGVCQWSPKPGYPAAGAWRTPLGDVEVDLDFALRLGEDFPALLHGARGHGSEHSLELQLPFLQRALGHFRLVPLVMGDQLPATVTALARALTRALDCDPTPTLLVASTDLSHFHDAGTATLLDERFLRLLQSTEEEPLLEGLAAGSCEACGGGPVVAVLGVLRRRMGKVEVRVLDHRDSSRVNGDTGSVVGYAAVMMGERQDG
jgi:AmmeMemoRadiSam system protein B